MSSLACRISPMPSSCSSDSAANLKLKRFNQYFVFAFAVWVLKTCNFSNLLKTVFVTEQTASTVLAWIDKTFWIICLRYRMLLSQTWTTSVAFFRRIEKVLSEVQALPDRTSSDRSGRASRAATSSCCWPSSARWHASSRRPSSARPPSPCSWWSIEQSYIIKIKHFSILIIILSPQRGLIWNSFNTKCQ